jgi:HEAT repeat protein
VSFLFPSSTITFDAALRDLASGSPKARAMAAHALGDVTDPVERRRAVDALVRALDDDRPEVRAEACGSLGELREDGVLPQLIKRLGDGAAPVRQNAAIALGTIGHADAFEPLAEALREGPADLRYQAATSLAEIDPARAFDFEVAALADRDVQVVAAAALAVGTIAAELADAPLRTRALEALSAALAAAPIASGPAPKPTTLGALATVLGSSRATARPTGDSARFDIAYALAELGDDRGKDALAEALADPDRAWDAVTALGKLRAKAELERAIASKQTPHEAATLAAGRLVAIDAAHAAARAVLIDALVARKLHVRGIAIEQLTEVGGAWAEQPLDKLAHSSKGADLLEPIAAAVRTIRQRSPS